MQTTKRAESPRLKHSWYPPLCVNCSLILHFSFILLQEHSNSQCVLWPFHFSFTCPCPLYVCTSTLLYRTAIGGERDACTRLVELDEDDHVGEDGAQQAGQRAPAHGEESHGAGLQVTGQAQVHQLFQNQAHIPTPPLLIGKPALRLMYIANKPKIILEVKMKCRLHRKSGALWKVIVGRQWPPPCHYPEPVVVFL